MMVGQIASLANDRFNFKLAGDNPSDPGLTLRDDCRREIVRFSASRGPENGPRRE